jgi:hypothetical protein
MLLIALTAAIPLFAMRILLMVLFPPLLFTYSSSDILVKVLRLLLLLMMSLDSCRSGAYPGLPLALPIVAERTRPCVESESADAPRESDKSPSGKPVNGAMRGEYTTGCTNDRTGREGTGARTSEELE